MEIGTLRKYFAAVAVLLAIVMAVLDGTIMNVALPTLSRDFGISPAETTWIVNAYQLMITISLLSFASLGDIYGYRRIFLIGVPLFTLSSFACALSPNFEFLIGARIFQGLGAGAVMSVNTALLRLIYPPDKLGRGMALNAMIIAVSAAAGPSIAGGILSVASWHWLFIINIPIGIVAFLIGKRLLPHNPQPTNHTFDKLGALVNALLFGLLIYSFDGFARSYSDWLIGVQLLLCGIVGYFFVRRELRMKAPLLPVDLLRIPIFSLSICTSIASFSAQMLAMVSLPFFLESTLGFDTIKTGLLLTPWPLATIISAPIAGRLIERVNAGWLGACGMLLFAIGLGLLYLLPAHPQTGTIVWRMALCGLGFGLFQTPNNVMIISAAPIQRSGGASGMLGTARLVGQTLGTVLVAMLFRIYAHGKGEEAALLMAVGFALVAGVLSVLRVGNKKTDKTASTK